MRSYTWIPGCWGRWALTALVGASLVASARAATPRETCAALRAHPTDTSLLQHLRQAISDVPDDPRLTAYMAAYSLGCLHAGMTDEGRRTRAFVLSRLGLDPAASRLVPERLDVPCSACAGSARATCPTCGGTGKTPSPAAVEREYLALLDELSGNAPSTQPAPAQGAAPTSAPAWGSMHEFVQMMQGLREQARSGKSESVELEAVISKPDAYAGRVVHCSGFVIGYHPKQITVSPDPDPASRLRLDLSPDSLYVGTKVGMAFRTSGQPVPVDLVFALINGNQNVAFAAEPVKASEP